MRKRLISIFIVVILIFAIYSCAQTAGDNSVTESEIVESEYTDEETSPIADASEQEEQTEKYDDANAAFQSNEDHKNVITYQVPLDEIAERIEYEYVYENMIDYIADQDYKQLSFLPSGEDIATSVYTVEGNKILFLPEEKTNTEVMVNGEPCRLHYCEEADGYVFYLLVDWQVAEDGIPVNSLENDYYYRIRECIVRDKDAVYEKTNLVNSPAFFFYEFELEDLVKLGDTKVTFDPEQTIELPEIPMENNEYMDAVAEFAASILRESGIYGSFRIYPETYGRVQGQYVDYPTRGKISAAIIGDGFEDYLFFEISEGGEINGDHVWPTYYPAAVDSPTYFVDQYFLQDEPEDFIDRIVGLQRGVIEMEVREDDALEEEADRTPYIAPEYDQDIDFHTMASEEIAELISYVYSYGEWFGMNELGCMTGELRGFQDETIIMYRWKEGGGSNRVYFVPKSKVNTYLKFGDGEYYPVYVNRDGEMEFFYLERNEYAGGNGQLKTGYFIQDHGFSDLETQYSEAMVCLGETELTLRELPSLDVPAIEEDEYVTALKEHIEGMLRQNGRSGEYEMNIGEYEASFKNTVCLSAAVTGEEDSYYFRYLIVKSGRGNYYFWPAGFGLNGSLEECEAGRHYMNALCIERTRQLERCSIVMEAVACTDMLESEPDKDESITVISKVAHYYTDESLNSRYEYKYDNLGNQVKEISYDAEGSIDGWREFRYDSAGKQTRYILYDADGSVVDCYDYEYDSEGNLTQEINNSDNGSTYFRTEYEYDSEGILDMCSCFCL